MSSLSIKKFIKLVLIKIKLKNVGSNEINSIDKAKRTTPTRELQNLVNKPLHAQKVDEVQNNVKEEKPETLFFDDTRDTPAIFEKRLDVPAFLRKNQD